MNSHPSPNLVKHYTIGFIGSLILTLAAYIATVSHSLSINTVIVVVSALAILQAMLQLFFFLHLGQDQAPRWRLYVFIFMLMIIAILVGGSYWIMQNLNYNMMQNPSQMNEYLHSQDAF